MATFALIHGGGGSARDWRLVVPELRRRGHDAVAVDLPVEDESAGLGDYADTVVKAVGDRPGLVVVGHSWGGFVAPLVCDRVRAELLVLVTAMIPAPGERPADWWDNTGWRPSSDGDADEVELFLHDVPPDLAADLMAHTRRHSGTADGEPWPLRKWPDVPTRFLLCRDDRFFTPAFMREVVRRRLGVTPDEIPGGHCPMLARPAELAEQLVGYLGRG
ncbi:alpha/beta fold hydrolase [Nonomuraea roseoviolacea subsp. roseoviolacea]|uniref:alpha/beta fold hydrolase n=1 Tax=Nonomuraea roseoviolacea TaxID=103837 RepID=UPI0031D12287